MEWLGYSPSDRREGDDLPQHSSQEILGKDFESQRVELEDRGVG
jgi:hypothetical protein